MTRSHANKATFSPPFLHPPSPSTATNMTPPTTDHTGEARGHGRRHTVGVQGMPAIFIFYLLFHLLQLDPQQPQHVPLHRKRADVPLLPPTTNLRCPPPAEHVPTSRTPERALVGTFWCSLFPSLVSNTRKCPHGCSRTSPLPSPSRTPPLSLSLVSNTRTSQCVARSGARTPPLFLSLVSSIRMSPHGLVLMFGHPSPSRPPERAHTGSFWCSGTSPLPLPRLEHQNEPTRARSGVRAPPLSLSLGYLPF